MITPSQTVGPFFGYALPYAGGGDVAPDGHPDTVVVHGDVYDGAGEPVPDALLEFWQPGGGVPGSLRRDGVRFTGFGRVATGPDGHWTVRTLPAPYICVCLLARGLLHHLYTRIYLSETADALLESLDPERRATLIATEERPGVHRFDVRMQGERETVFLEFA